MILKMKYWIILVLIGSLPHLAVSQFSFKYNFDGCQLNEVNGSLGALTQVGSPSCTCGPQNDAFEFANRADFLKMPLPGNLLQQDNFSFSFYIRPSGSGTAIQQIFSNEKVCGQADSLFSVQYYPSVRTVAVRLSDFGASVGFVEGTLQEDKCWHQIMFVKKGRILQIFVNGVEGGVFQGNQPISVFASDSIRVAHSTCGVGANITAFTGGLDEITWYDRALSPSEVLAEYIPVDEIITSDTLIFLGDMFTPRVSSSCANSINWSPGNGLSSTSVIQPEIGPVTTQNYAIQFQYSGCLALDSLTVVVIDENDVDCEKILLPTAFTPNGDFLNDEYAISNPFIVDELIQFDIMDRQGNTLFSAEDANQAWDGMYKGKTMSSGIYVYKLAYDCRGETYSKTGSFNIIR